MAAVMVCCTANAAPVRVDPGHAQYAPPARPVVAQLERVFGPERYTRATGAPQTFTDTFESCGSAECRIVVFNGNADGTNRVTSATIVVNGVQVLGPSDFKKDSASITAAVSVSETNTIEVTVHGKPGSFITVNIACPDSEANLDAGPPGASLIGPGLLAFTMPIYALGSEDAENVQVTTLTLEGGTLVTPLPIHLGTIPAGGSVLLNATFTGAFPPLSEHDVLVEGTYAVGTETFCFTFEDSVTVPPLAPGSAPLRTAIVEALTVTGAPYPPIPPRFNPVQTNPPGWTVPTGPFIPGTPTPGQTLIGLAPQDLRQGLERESQQGAGPIIWGGNRGVGIGDGSTTAEPSGASGGGVVFMTANWFAAYSTDNGATWTELDPTTIFPNDAVGFCCDQIVQYAPSIDRFIWLLQGTGYRLAMASPAQIISSGGTAWTYWNLTPGVFGQPAGTGLDYPSMALGNNSLYMDWDAGTPCGTGCEQGFQVVRTSLAGIQAGGTITVEFTDPDLARMAWGSHVTQNTGNEVFWAGHNSNSQMRVFSLAEGSNTYFWRDRNISSWPNNAPSSLTPDNRDWLAKNFNGPGGNSFPRNGIIGATRQFNLVWFAWTAGTNSFFDQAHVQMVAFDRSDDFDLDQQVQIWNDSYAFAYPALAFNSCSGDVGLSLEFGGGGNYENHVVGFWGDFIVYITSSSNVGTTRFGDYVTLRQRPFTPEAPGNLFDAFGYGLRSTPTGTTVDIRYVTFGRPASACQIGEPGLIATSGSGEEGSAPLAESKPLAPEFALRNNPMVSGAKLELHFSTPRAATASLRIYDAAGALVKTLVDGDVAAGEHVVTWTGTSDRDRRVAPGVYFVSLDVADRRHRARVIVLP